DYYCGIGHSSGYIF
nr:immunoglobulin light chain junction region [Macaca mulatta]MOY14993.1 immunoglobulin light chain junction region [Macaca mulatta]MOY15802.1 immunoglobulin light chain junction region [Macaca mulatta]MOY16039.1 immunoglobulin light chain junction region [Macaca mulatta]MOY16184.1 immunoglobulin light chain junction region [Macaca mulatta]